MAAVVTWGKLLANHCICFNTDNEVVVHVINKQTSRNSCIMHMVRTLVLYTLKYNILFRAKHVPGLLNNQADALSRLQVEDFKRMHPTAEPQPTQLPAHALQTKLLKS